jgi:hypothetical protein
MQTKTLQWVLLLGGVSLFIWYSVPQRYYSMIFLYRLVLHLFPGLPLPVL